MGIGLLAASQRQLTPCISGASATGEERRGVRNCKESSHRSSVSVGQAGAQCGENLPVCGRRNEPFLAHRARVGEGLFGLQAWDGADLQVESDQSVAGDREATWYESLSPGRTPPRKL